MPISPARRFLAIALLCAAAGALVAGPADAQRRRVYSGLEEFRTAGVSPGDGALLRRDVLPEARRLWARVEGCRDEFRAIDAAAGSFTRRGAEQRAVLYRFCETGHDFARGGVAIVQGGRVVAHVTIEDAQPDGLRALADVDQDGVSELVLVDNATHQGEATTLVSIIQLLPRGVRSFGLASAYHSTPRGEARRDVGHEQATVLYATPARRPLFEAETYGHSDNERSRWRGTHRLHRIDLEPDRTTYRRVR
jgi:hypothetical protein